MKLLRRKSVWCLGIFVVLPGLFLTEEHVRGSWRLARWKSQQQARGEKFAIEECLAPAHVRVENRFRDLMAACAGRRGQDLLRVAPPTFQFLKPGQAVALRQVEHWTRKPGDKERKTDPGLTNTTWVDVGDALAPWSDSLQRAKAMLHEPRLDAELDYYMGFSMLLPHLGPLKVLGQHLNVAALHELHLGHLDTGLDDIKDLLAITRVLEDERVIISQLIRQTVANIAVGTTWQALQYPGWTDAQLADLQQTWLSLEFLEPMIQACEMERACVIHTFANMRGSVTAASQALDLGGGNRGGGSGKAIASLGDLVEYVGDNSGEIFTHGVLIPSWQFAWSHQDELYYLNRTQTCLEAARACAQAHTFGPVHAVQATNGEWIHPGGLNRIRHLVSWQFSDGLPGATEKAVNAEGLKQLVIAAIALHRHQLRHGRPASTLEQLVPEFLPAVPIDVWSGEPLRYRLTPDQPPLLYGVGKDGRDNGGDPTVVQGSLNGLGVLSGRDVVWPAPATPDEIAKAGPGLKRN